MQPYLFPYIGYFQLLCAVDEFVLYDDVNHIVRGWVNRNNYLVNNDKKLISLSVKGASSNKLIRDLEFVNDFHKYISTLETAYAKAPYKEQVMKLIKNILSGDNMHITSVVERSIEGIIQYLDIDGPRISSSSEIKGHNELRGQKKILNICAKLDADVYINPSGGKDLYNQSTFEEKGIKLKFIEPGITEYKQLTSEFVPGLSIVDVMMFNSPSNVKEMLNNYELV